MIILLLLRDRLPCLVIVTVNLALGLSVKCSSILCTDTSLYHSYSKTYSTFWLISLYINLYKAFISFLASLLPSKDSPCTDYLWPFGFSVRRTFINVRSSNTRSEGHFNRRWKLVVIGLVITSDLLRFHAVPVFRHMVSDSSACGRSDQLWIIYLQLHSCFGRVIKTDRTAVFMRRVLQTSLISFPLMVSQLTFVPPMALSECFLVEM